MTWSNLLVWYCINMFYNLCDSKLDTSWTCQHSLLCQKGEKEKPRCSSHSEPKKLLNEGNPVALSSKPSWAFLFVLYSLSPLIFLCRADTKETLIPGMVASNLTFMISNKRAWLWPEIEMNVAIMGQIDTMGPLIWEEHSTIAMIFLAKYISQSYGNITQTENEGDSTKSLVWNLQKYWGHERQGTIEESFQIERD